jgi:2-methylisocitrate lyase-like PEP mutase family enzyme
VNVLALPRGPSVGELTELGAARISWGTLLHRDAMARFETVLRGLRSRGR